MNVDLERINWFVGVGDHIDVKKLVLPVKVVGSYDEVIQNFNSINWGNFILYAKNRLSWYMKYFHREQAKIWNDIAREAHAWYGQYDPLIAEEAMKWEVPCVALPYCKAIWVSYYMEQYYYSNVSREIPMHFNKMVEIFLEGHIPCGWEGPMPENEGFDAIDLDKGKILIW